MIRLLPQTASTLVRRICFVLYFSLLLFHYSGRFRSC